MKKYITGMLVGAAGGIISLLSLLFAPGLELPVYFSTVAVWIAAGLLISACDFKLKGVWKGLAVSLLISASPLIFTYAASISAGVWNTVSTAAVGAILGWMIERVQARMDSKSGEKDA